MSSFSNIIDVSSFFIGILINLLLVALICYYFKRKIDNLEVAQSEQAKILYTMIENNQKERNQSMNTSEVLNTNSGFLQNLDLGSLQTKSIVTREPPEVTIEKLEDNESISLNVSDGEIHSANNSVSDSDSDSDSDSNSQSERELVQHDEDEMNDFNSESVSEKVEHESLLDQDENEDDDTNDEENTKEIKLDENQHQYEKMTIKELKEQMEINGIQQRSKGYLKKNEMIDILNNHTYSVKSVIKTDRENEVALENEEEIVSSFDNSNMISGEIIHSEHNVMME